MNWCCVSIRWRGSTIAEEPDVQQTVVLIVAEREMSRGRMDSCLNVKFWSRWAIM